MKLFLNKPFTISKAPYYPIMILIASLVAVPLGLRAFPVSRPATAAQKYRGHDLLALQHPQWPCEATVAHFSAHHTPLAVGLLWETFGNNTECVKQILALDRPLYIRAHLFNSVCVRNRNCGTYEPLAGYTVKSLRRALSRREPSLISALQKRAREVETTLLLSRKKEKLQCGISGFLEHNLSSEAARVVAEVLHNTLTHCEVVDNPVDDQLKRGYTFPPNVVQEMHHLTPPRVPAPPCIVSLDGDLTSGASLRELAEKFPQCKAAFFWQEDFNCRRAGAFVDPRKRTRCLEEKKALKLTN